MYLLALDTLSKQSRRAIINFIISNRPSVRSSTRMEQLDSHLTDFPWNLYREVFLIKVFGTLEFWTPYSKRLTNSELAEKFPTFCGASLFITAFSKTGHWTLSWYRLHTFSLKLLLLLSPFYDSFPQVVPTFQRFSSLPWMLHSLPIMLLSISLRNKIFCDRFQIMQAK